MSRRGKGEDEEREVRLDKWLWAAKPSRTVAVGQELRIASPRGEFTVIVEQVSAQRGSASVAATFFKETDESKVRRMELAEMHRLSRVFAPDEKPNTQDRRLLRRLKEGS
jgi:ribosome-associated heat shock protein Hsp15